MNDLTDNDDYGRRPLDKAAPDTRGEILFAACREIQVKGFRSASLSGILARSGVTRVSHNLDKQHRCGAGSTRLPQLIRTAGKR